MSTGEHPRSDVMERWDDDCDLIQVILTPDEARRLRTSLAFRGMELYAIPSSENDLPAYGIRTVTS